MILSSNGWIKLHRQMLDWEWYTDLPVKTLYLHLLLRANHAPGAWRGIAIDRGELVTPIDHLAKETGLSVQQVRTALRKLEKTGEIVCEATNRFRRIKCCNYSLYQDAESGEQQADSKPSTSYQQTDNKQATANKKNKKYKNNNKNNKLRREMSFDIERIKHDALYNDDYDI
jgi:biotin operon repressor